MFGIYARLDKNEKNILLNLAQRERRDPRDQAAFLIRQQLEQLGLLQPTTRPAQGVQRERQPA